MCFLPDFRRTFAGAEPGAGSGVDMSDLLASSKSGLESIDGVPVLEPARVGDCVDAPSFCKSAFSRPVTASDVARNPLRSIDSPSFMSDIRCDRGTSLGSPNFVIIGAEAPLTGSLTIRLVSFLNSVSLLFFSCLASGDGLLNMLRCLLTSSSLPDM